MDNFEPKILAFVCTYCTYTAADMAGSQRLQYPTDVRIVKFLCTGKIEIIHILKAFESGADAIFVLGCPEKKCHLLNGNDRALKVVNYTKGLLDEIGIEHFRLDMFQLVTPEDQHFDRIINKMTERIETLSHV